MPQASAVSWFHTAAGFAVKHSGGGFVFRRWNRILFQKMKQNAQKLHGYIVQVEHCESIQYGEFR